MPRPRANPRPKLVKPKLATAMKSRIVIPIPPFPVLVGLLRMDSYREVHKGPPIYGHMERTSRLPLWQCLIEYFTSYVCSAPVVNLHKKQMFRDFVTYVSGPRLLTNLHCFATIIT